MLFAYVVCSLLVAEVYSYYPIRFRDGSESGSVDRPKQQGIIRVPITRVPIGHYPYGPVYPPNNPDGKNHPKHEGKHEQKHPHESRDAETQQKVREIYEELVKRHNDIVNDERKQIDLVDNIVDSFYGDYEAERKVEEFLKRSPIGDRRYNQVRQEIKNLLNEIDNAEGSNRAGKLSQLQGDLNKLVYGLYNEVAHSSRRRLEFIKFIVDGVSGDKRAAEAYWKEYSQYPEDAQKLLDATEEVWKDINEVRRLYDDALSARQVAEQVKGYALDVELGNN